MLSFGRLWSVACCLLITCIVSISAPPVHAEAVYSNLLSYAAMHHHFSGFTGEEITLDGAGRIIESATFMYGLGTSETTGRVLFLLPDGPLGAPGTIIFDSGSFLLPITASATLFTIDVPDVLVPSTFIFGFEYGPHATSDQYFPIYGPPSIGSVGNSWSQTTNCVWGNCVTKWVSRTNSSGLGYAIELKARPALVKGDINGDNTVNLADAILSMQVMSGMNPVGIRAVYTTSGADVDGDGKIGLPEVLYILQKAAGAR